MPELHQKVILAVVARKPIKVTVLVLGAGLFSAEGEAARLGTFSLSPGESRTIYVDLCRHPPVQ
jgi:hypothetical protein